MNNIFIKNVISTYYLKLPGGDIIGELETIAALRVNKFDLSEHQSGFTIKTFTGTQSFCKKTGFLVCP